MESKKKEPSRLVGTGDLIVISFFLLVFVFFRYASVQKLYSGDANAEVVRKTTAAEKEFGEGANLVGTQLYGANDPFVFFQHEWKQQTLGDQVKLGWALLRFNRAIRMEWHDQYKGLRQRAFWLFQAAQLDRATPPLPNLIRDPEWVPLREWWKRVGMNPTYPAKTWDNLEVLNEEFQHITSKETLTAGEEARIDAIVRELGENGLGLKYVPNANGRNGRFDFSAPLEETSSLFNVINLRKMNHIILTAE